MRYLKALWFWLYFPIVTFVMFSAIGIGRWLYIIRGKRSDLYAHKCAGIWAKLTLRLMPGWNMEVIGAENMPKPGEQLVVVANHQSSADIWAVYALGFQFRWMAKDSLFKVPCIGQAMRWCRYIPVIRGEKESHKQAMRDASERIESGVPMFFFPEGTRSLTGEMRPFKIGAFKLAAQHNIPVTPIVISGAKDLVKKGSTIPGVATVRMQILPKVTRLDGEDIEKFAARVRGLIEAKL